ncbi:hypothetical protein [Amycolatopsis sp. lyj-90]|uniref:hypothetical protein n=1 Tax=Amycolatopsis sp. lyj-90 TaxID=2789285 RepID=UPI0039786F31
MDGEGFAWLGVASMTESNIVILGSGSLARSIAYSLAGQCTTRSVVTIVSRMPASAAELCYVADARAVSAGRPVRFVSRPLNSYRADFLASLLRHTRPGIVVNCASVQSPWERARSRSAWTDLMTRAGAGVTLPLQAAIPIEVASAVAAVESPPLFLNASLPDAVNPLLRALGLPVFCGVGNVALIAASLQEALRPEKGVCLRVVGHHRHLRRPESEEDEAVAWLDGTPVRWVTSLLERQRATARSELNFVNGEVTAKLLTGLLTGAEIRTSLPGPHGFPGGYPVRVRGRTLTLDLPPGLRLDQAVAMNKDWAEQDGVLVEESGSVVFGERGVREMRVVFPGFPSVVRAGEIPDLCTRLLRLRAWLRKVDVPLDGSVPPSNVRT